MLGVQPRMWIYNDKEEKYTGFYTGQMVRTNPDTLQNLAKLTMYKTMCIYESFITRSKPYVHQVLNRRI